MAVASSMSSSWPAGVLRIRELSHANLLEEASGSFCGDEVKGLFPCGEGESVCQVTCAIAEQQRPVRASCAASGSLTAQNHSGRLR